MFRFALLLIAPMILGAVTQPAPVISGVQNSASNLAPGLPGAGIAQGSIFTVYGSNFGTGTCNQAVAFPLPTQVCGVSLTVTVNGTSVAPYILGVYFGDQINAILPSLTPTGNNGTISVSYGGQTSATLPIQVVNAAFGAFTPSQSGSGQASVTYNSDGSLNTIIHTLHPGDIAVLWGTGLGPIQGSDAVVPTAGNVGSPTVYVGNTALTLSSGLYYAGRSPQYPGLDQIDFTVPQGVQGCYVPIAVETGGVVGNVGTIAVSAAGQNTCSDSLLGQDLVNKLAAGGTVNFGYIRLESTLATVAGLATSGSGSLGDDAFATFSSFTPQTAWYAEYGVSSGYCVSTQYNDYAYTILADLSVFDALLNAGSALSIQGPLVAPGPFADVDPPYGYYWIGLSGTVAHYFYSGDTYTVTGSGGTDVGAFTATDTTSIPSVTFTGIANDQPVPRTSNLAVQWTFSNNNLQNVPVTIGGFSASITGNLYTAFQCTAPAGATSFTIPSWLLSTLPPSGTETSGSFVYPLGFIWVGQYNTPKTFTAPGLDRGIISDAFFQGKIVNYQ